MSASLLFSFVIGYFILLLVVAWVTSRNSNNDSFFIGNRNSNWMLVAFGMVGTSLSGITFVSVPGTVGDFAGNAHRGFAYFAGTSSCCRARARPSSTAPAGRRSCARSFATTPASCTPRPTGGSKACCRSHM